jgi:hypothetical protein
VRAPDSRELLLRTHSWPVLLWVGPSSAGLRSDRGWHATPSATLSKTRSRCSSWLCSCAFVVASKRVHLCHPPRCRRCPHSPTQPRSWATAHSGVTACTPHHQHTYLRSTPNAPLYPARPSSLSRTDWASARPNRGRAVTAGHRRTRACVVIHALRYTQLSLRQPARVHLV